MEPEYCRHCGKEIARIPEWPLNNGIQYHHIKATDEDTLGRYHMDCADEDADGQEAEP